MNDDRVPLKSDPVPSDAPTAPQEQKVFEGELTFMDDIEYHRISDLLDVSYDERKDHHTAEQLSFLTDWAREQTGSDDRLQVVERIKLLKRMLGLTEKGIPLIKKLYQWTRLDQRRLQIEKEQSLIAGS